MRPAWNDEEALIDYVVQAILDLSRGGDPIPPVKATGPTDAAAHAVLNERRDHQRKAVLDKYGLTESPFRSEPKLIGWDELESELVPIAESGNYAPLFRLLRIPAARAALKESTWQLIVAIGSRQHKPKGRRRQTKAERFNSRDSGRIHRAEYLVSIIYRLLSAWYPKQTEADHRDQALKIAAAIHGIKSDETLRTHLKRPKGDRHRLVDEAIPARSRKS